MQMRYIKNHVYIQVVSICKNIQYVIIILSMLSDSLGHEKKNC